MLLEIEYLIARKQIHSGRKIIPQLLGYGYHCPLIFRNMKNGTKYQEVSKQNNNLEKILLAYGKNQAMVAHHTNLLPPDPTMIYFGG